MGSLVYIRLIGLTAGTLLQLFWMVVILGYRRQRNFERVFFFLCLALFFFYSGSLLALNAQIHYLTPPPLLTAFARTLLCGGLCFLPALLIHLHFEYADTRGMVGRRALKRLVLIAAYAPVLYFALRVYPLLASSPGFDFLVPGNALGRGYGVWLAAAMLVSAAWEIRFLLSAPDRPQTYFHTFLAGVFAIGAALTLVLHVFGGPLRPDLSDVVSTVLALLAIPAFAVLIYLVGQFNFLQIGRQKNLVYAVSATFLALLYLSLVRRLSGWLEPVLPPEATASILLFVLVIFFEPLQRMLSRRLQETAHREMAGIQQLTVEIHQEARQGNLRNLIRFIERKVRERLGIENAWLSIIEPNLGAEFVHKSGSTEESYSVYVPGRLNAILSVKPHGAMVSGETQGALEALCRQLPGAIELCRVLEEKLGLERELAERERLALLGQMAASISHNLKNPLGSIKTILQVQMENPELPDSLRGETRIVLDEISRLSAKLNQLLQFSRPVVRGGTVEAACEAPAVVEEVVGVLRREAERRGVALDVRVPTGAVRTATGAGALSDIISNLVVNALEATPQGGRVEVSAAMNDGNCILTVEDTGAGIPADLRERILQPFFTTKTQGTGLGLAIVARRVAESSGKLEWESPAKDGRGSRFRVTLPARE